jgi:hypothetical protein
MFAINADQQEHCTRIAVLKWDKVIARLAFIAPVGSGRLSVVAPHDDGNAKRLFSGATSAVPIPMAPSKTLGTSPRKSSPPAPPSTVGVLTTAAINTISSRSRTPFHGLLCPLTLNVAVDQRRIRIHAAQGHFRIKRCGKTSQPVEHPPGLQSWRLASECRDRDSGPCPPPTSLAGDRA